MGADLHYGPVRDEYAGYVMLLAEPAGITIAGPCGVLAGLVRMPEVARTGR